MYRPKHKYDKSYLNFGLRSSDNSDTPYTICVLCHKKLENNPLALAKLFRYFKTIHVDNKVNDISFIRDKVTHWKSLSSK